jgi:hypothetical protein
VAGVQRLVSREGLDEEETADRHPIADAVATSSVRDRANLRRAPGGAGHQGSHNTVSINLDPC